jgi:putative DNA primase/helicase
MTTPNGTPLPLSNKHLADLVSSGLREETIRQAGLYSEADSVRIGQILHWQGPATRLGNCLVFPYPDPLGNRTGYHRLKPDQPRHDDKGKPFKYEAPFGQENHVYFPPKIALALANPATPLLLTEGEKKCLAAYQNGLPCLGLSGVDCGTRDGILIPDLMAIPWRGRTLFIVFDSDRQTNTNIQWAEWRLSQVLGKLGADVRVVQLPAGPPHQENHS